MLSIDIIKKYNITLIIRKNTVLLFKYIDVELKIMQLKKPPKFSMLWLDL